LTISIAVVHGINTEPRELAELVADVECLVRGVVLDAVPVEYHHIRWQSTGTIAGDVWALRSSAFIEEQLAGVQAQLFRAQPSIVIGHSMGVAFGHAGLMRAGMRRPLVGIGSPFGHPVLGRYLTLAGMARKPNDVRVDIWNADDPVTTLLGRGHRALDGWRSVRVAVAGHLGFREHSHKRYIYADGKSGPVHGATVRAIAPLVYAAAGIEVH
jgi:hypothetical protein